MDRSVVVLTFNIIFALCCGFSEGQSNSREKFCGLSERTRQIVLSCVIENFDEHTRQYIAQLEECSGAEMYVVVNDICEQKDLETILKFTQCEIDLGLQNEEPSFDQDAAVQCARRKLLGNR